MPLSADPLISIITINWNSTATTRSFLESALQVIGDMPVELIVVDNHSEHDPTAEIAAIDPAIRVVNNTANLGYGGGMNSGMRKARGRYFLFVNNDILFTPGVLEGLLSVFRMHADAGIVSPKIRFSDRKEVIEYAGYKALTPVTGQNGMVGWNEKDIGQYEQLQSTNYPHGAAMMVPRTVVEHAGMFPESFFLYYEELDWAERIRRKGYKIYYQPASLIYHKGSETTGSDNRLKTYYLTRNRILFIRRNQPLLNRYLFYLYFISVAAPYHTMAYLLKGKKEHLFAFWKAIWWHVVNRRRAAIVS
jgi:GT2 family glycosyltransferase